MKLNRPVLMIAAVMLIACANWWNGTRNSLIGLYRKNAGTLPVESLRAIILNKVRLIMSQYWLTYWACMVQVHDIWTVSDDWKLFYKHYVPMQEFRGISC